jgi:hypothetical protein
VRQSQLHILEGTKPLAASLERYKNTFRASGKHGQEISWRVVGIAGGTHQQAIDVATTLALAVVADFLAKRAKSRPMPLAVTQRWPLVLVVFQFLLGLR